MENRDNSQKRTAMKKHSLPVVVTGTCSILILGACQTSFSNLRQNVSNGFHWPSFSGKSENGQPEEDKTLSLDGLMACPSVRVVDDLSALSEFTDPQNPGSGTMVSEVTLSKQRGTCIYNSEDKSVAVQVSLVFDSRLGPRSKVYKGDKPSFAYPYFIAVTSPDGEIMAKEVFAASLSYGPNQESLQHKETLRQIIPLDNLQEGPGYSILAGFQLTEEQLEYNRMNRSGAIAPSLAEPAERIGTPATSAPQQAKTMKPIMDDPDPAPKPVTKKAKPAPKAPPKPSESILTPDPVPAPAPSEPPSALQAPEPSEPATLQDQPSADLTEPPM